MERVGAIDNNKQAISDIDLNYILANEIDVRQRLLADAYKSNREIQPQRLGSS